MVVYGVASPAKFPEALERAGIAWSGPSLMEELRGKETRYSDWGADEDWYVNLLHLLQSISARLSHE